MNRIVLSVALIAGLLLLSVPRTDAGMMVDVTSIKKEIATAAYHSGELAQKGGALAATQLHLQHTINCLEGPSGMHFKAAAGYPCQGMGNGVVPDLKAAVAANVPGAKNALSEATQAWTLALQAEEMKTVEEAQPWAAVVSRHLKAALADLGG